MVDWFEWQALVLKVIGTRSEYSVNPAGNGYLIQIGKVKMNKKEDLASLFIFCAQNTVGLYQPTTLYRLMVLCKIYSIWLFIIYLKRFPFTLHWSNRAIFFAYCMESSAYCTELRSHVH